MKQPPFTFLFIFVVSFIACQSSPTIDDNSQKKKGALQDEAHFALIEKQGYSILEIREPFKGSDIIEKFVLYPRGADKPEEENITHYIETPIQRIGISSTTHIGYLNVLNKRNNIRALVNTDLIYDQELKNRVEDGKVISLGEQSINQELLIQSELDVLFDYAIDISAYKKIKQLRSLGQVIIPIAEYMEHDPIVKMKWLKVFSIFFSTAERKRANVFVDSVEANYKKYVDLADKRPYKATVMVGYPWQGNWFVSGGKSFQAKYFEDANVDYIWKNTPQVAGLALSTETVLKDALNSDYWINPGVMQSKMQLIDNDPRFRNFRAFKQNNIYTNYKRSNFQGANDYWESAVVRPDRVLLDLISIFSQDQFSTDSLYYYKPLEP